MRYGKLLLIRRADQGRFKTLADLDRPGSQDRLQQRRVERPILVIPERVVESHLINVFEPKTHS
jgi:hypothetical protein